MKRWEEAFNVYMAKLLERANHCYCKNEGMQCSTICHKCILINDSFSEENFFGLTNNDIVFIRQKIADKEPFEQCFKILFNDNFFERYKRYFKRFAETGTCDGIDCNFCLYGHDINRALREELSTVQRRIEYLNEEVVDEEMGEILQ